MVRHLPREACAAFCVLFADHPVDFGLPSAFGESAVVPAWLKSMSENKFQTAIMTFWVFNIVSANVLNTGAFEVFYDGELVSSKLQSGKLPRVDKIFEGIRAIQGK